MKNLFINLILLLVCSWGCQKNSPDPVNSINECVGFSDYVINNQSGYDLSAELMFSAELGSKTDSSQTIASKQIQKIAQDASFGSIPKPTNTFSRLVLYRTINGRKVVAYTQNPITNERWIKIKRTASDPDYGCYSVTNSLTVTDNDLK